MPIPPASNPLSNSTVETSSASPALAAAMLRCCDAMGAAFALPRVDHVYLPPPQEHGEKSRKFGLVVLEDASTGFFYTRLDASAAEIARSQYPRDPLELAHWYADADVNRRAAGLGAIGAISQALFARAGFSPPQAVNPLADFDFGPDDHVGMVGYFPALVDKLRRRGIRLTVLELEESWLQSGERFEVTLDPAGIADCNKVLCTASTLINDTIDDVLTRVSGAERVALIGPSAGCIPDPLFERGVTVVGGSRVVDHAALEAHCNAGSDWGPSVSKYCLTRATWPGFAAVLAIARGR